MIRVMLVEDVVLLRTALRIVLEQAGDIEVVREAGDGRAALKVGREKRPDMFLMDLRMPMMSGPEAIRALRSDPLLMKVPVLVLTTFDDDDDIIEAMAAGADGHLVKDIDAEDLRDAVRRAAAGKAQVAPRVLRRMMNRLARLPSARNRDPRLTELTDRELRGGSLRRRGPLRPPLWREALGRRLHQLRRDRDERLVDTASRAGIWVQYLSQIECGVEGPSSEMVAAIAGALDITVVDLVSGVAEEMRTPDPAAVTPIRPQALALAA